MNREYIYSDGKITITDEFGKKHQEEYCNNIDEMLIQENVIEMMEKEIEKLKTELKKYEQIKTNKLFWLFPLLGCIVVSSIAPIVIMPTLTNQSIISLIKDAFYSNYVLSITSVVFPIGISFGAMLSTFEYIMYQKEIKESNGLISKIDYLNKELMTKKEKLKLLQKDKSIDVKNVKPGIVKVDDKIAIIKLKDEIEQYYELGYNIKKYSRYYTKGKLDDKLPKQIDMNYAKEYIKQKKLVKKK